MNMAHAAGSRPAKLAHRTVLGFALALMSVLSGCSDTGSSLPGISDAETITSEDGGLEMQIPDSWEERRDLNPSAALQAGNREDDVYGLVIVDPREFFEELSLGQFADIEIQRFVDTVGNPSLSGPELVIVDEREALQYQISGVVDEQEVTYLYTFAETPDRFLKIVTWSEGTRYEENREQMQQVTESVRQLAPLGDVQPSPQESLDIPTEPTPVPSIDRGDQ